MNEKRILFYPGLRRIMKWMCVLLVFGATALSAKPDQKLTFRNHRGTLNEFFKEIEKQSDYRFFYNDELVDIEQDIYQLNMKNKSIDEVLESLLANTGLKYRKLDNNLIVISSMELLQNQHVTGTVVDAVTGESLPGVNIVVKGTPTLGTVTDADGGFSLNVPDNTAVLVFSFIGYTTQEVAVGSQRTLRIALEEDNLQLEEVVVVAYGTVKKKDLTGAVTAVDTKVIGLQSNSTVTRSLEGAVPGLQVASVDGQPGLDMGIRVRGLGTAEQSNANALIVIDGIPVETSDAAHSNPLSTINPKDIASITVLKDAASTALYGSRGANGVVLVTTKRGTSGKAKISLETRWGINQAGPNMLNTISDPKDVYEYVWQMNYNSYRFGANGNGGSLNYATNVQNPNYSHEEAALFASQHLFDYNGTSTFQRNILGNWMLYKVPGAIYTPTSANTSAESATMTGAYLVNPDGRLNPDAVFLGSDTYKNHLLQDRFRQEYNLSVNGGTEKIDYHVSVGYLQDPSYIKTSHFERYNGRANVNAQALSWLKIGTNVAYTYRNTNSPPNRSGEGRNMGDNNENVFAVMYGQNQLTQLYARDENWNYIPDENGNRSVHKSAGDTWSPLGPTCYNYFSPGNFDVLYIMENDLDQQKSNNLDTKIYADVKFLKDFTFNTSFSMNKYFMNRTKYRNATYGRASAYRSGTPGWLGKETWGTTNINAQQLLSYSHDFGKHHVEAMAGHEYNEYSREWMVYRSTNELIPGFITYANFVGHYTGDRMAEPGGGADRFAMESYLGRANYTYSDKYYLTASLRQDGSSKFKYNNTRWGTFWSLGGGWRISSEEFMKGTEDWLNNLKLRASYGVIGNQNGVPTYATYQTWSYSANYQQAVNGQGVPESYNINPNSYVNEYLTWENNHTTDIGVEFDLFTILHGTVDWYNRDNVNAIINQPIAFSLGQNEIGRNAAKIRNRGFEVELGIDLIRKKDMTWTVSLNGTHYTTTMLLLPEGLGSPMLGGNQLAGISGWSASGGGTAGSVMLRGTGLPYFNSYLPHYAGVDQSTGLPLYYHKVTEADHTAGKFMETAVGKGVNTTDYSIADRYEQGDVIPKWIGGFNTMFSYRGFDFATVLAYQLGGLFFRRDFMYFHYANEMQRDGGTIGISEDLLHNTWTPTRTNARFPMAMYNNGNGYGSGTMVPTGWTDMSQFSASYLSLKNVTLGYNLPRSLLKKAGISNLRIFVEGDNLLLFSASSGIDPRMDLTGGFAVDNYVYPFLRTYSLGINLDF
ncbi:MAG: TonB-dependent receptor [Tannerella sp.]|jgi:TonB-linked SusC/RagA family outer membrane protein|nr:TonB-dependent receptor [Tannerella sp.]